MVNSTMYHRDKTESDCHRIERQVRRIRCRRLTLKKINQPEVFEVDHFLQNKLQQICSKKPEPVDTFSWQTRTDPTGIQKSVPKMSKHCAPPKLNKHCAPPKLNKHCAPHSELIYQDDVSVLVHHILK